MTGLDTRGAHLERGSTDGRALSTNDVAPTGARGATLTPTAHGADVSAPDHGPALSRNDAATASAPGATLTPAAYGADVSAPDRRQALSTNNAVRAGARGATLAMSGLGMAAVTGGGVVIGRGWVWPVLFLIGAVAIGLLVGRRPWLVVGLMVSTGALLAAPAVAVGYFASVWMWIAALVGAAVVVRGARRCLPDGPTLLWRLALLLPTAEREFWRAEVNAILHACGSDAETRRQVIGFLTAVPATVVASWRYRR